MTFGTIIFRDEQQGGKLISTPYIANDGPNLKWPNNYRPPTKNEQGHQVKFTVKARRITSLYTHHGDPWLLKYQPLQAADAGSELKYTGVDHLYLSLNRFGQLNTDRNNFQIEKVRTLDRIVDLSKNNGRSYAPYLADLHRREQRAHPTDRIATFRTSTRLIVGSGTPNPREFGMTLHHLYGCPYLPASGLKGAVRATALRECFGSSEKDALQDQSFCDLFGCPEQSYYPESRRGTIVFRDAFPLTAPRLERDTITAHYQSYYGSNGRRLPVDTDKVIPVPFLAVAAGVDFRFRWTLLPLANSNQLVIAGRLQEETGETEPLAVIHKLLEQTLTIYGVGAKTAVGYGYFQTP